MVLEWTLGLKGLAYSMTPGSTFFAAATVCISRVSEPPDILYETCACIIHTINLQLHNRNNATCRADSDCAAHSFSISEN